MARKRGNLAQFLGPNQNEKMDVFFSHKIGCGIIFVQWYFCLSSLSVLDLRIFTSQQIAPLKEVFVFVFFRDLTYAAASLD